MTVYVVIGMNRAVRGNIMLNRWNRRWESILNLVPKRIGEPMN